MPKGLSWRDIFAIPGSRRDGKPSMAVDPDAGGMLGLASKDTDYCDYWADQMFHTCFSPTSGGSGNFGNFGADGQEQPMPPPPIPPIRLNGKRSGPFGKTPPAEASDSKGFSVKPESFHNGTLLVELVCDWLEAASPWQLENLRRLPKEVSYASGCTGSASESRVLEAFEAAFAKKNLHFKKNKKFECEISVMKQTWLLCTDPMSDACVFGSIEHLHRGKCECARHGPHESKSPEELGKMERKVGSAKRRKVLKVNDVKKVHCSVEEVFLWFCGSSCKFFSRQNPAAERRNGGAAHLLSTQSVNCESLRTYCGHLAYVQTYKPVAICFENVDSCLDDSGGEQSSEFKSNIDCIIDQLEEAGYFCMAFIVNCSDYGLPQSRNRLYLLALQAGSTLHNIKTRAQAHVLWQAVIASIRAMRRNPPDVRDVLLPASDAAVQAELARRSAAETKDELGSRWQPLHRSMFRLADLRWGREVPCESTLACPWYNNMPRREQEVLTYHEKACRPKKMRDLSQAINRERSEMRHSSGVEIVPTCMPNMDLWIPEMVSHPDVGPRLLIGREAMMFNGYPIANVEGHFEALQVALARARGQCVFENLLGDMGGNAYPTTVVAALTLALLMNVDWLDPEQEMTSQLMSAICSDLFA